MRSEVKNRNEGESTCWLAWCIRFFGLCSAYGSERGQSVHERNYRSRWCYNRRELGYWRGVRLGGRGCGTGDYRGDHSSGAWRFSEVVNRCTRRGCWLGLALAIVSTAQEVPPGTNYGSVRSQIFSNSALRLNVNSTLDTTEVCRVMLVDAGIGGNRVEVTSLNGDTQSMGQVQSEWAIAQYMSGGKIGGWGSSVVDTLGGAATSLVGTVVLGYTNGALQVAVSGMGTGLLNLITSKWQDIDNAGAIGLSQPDNRSEHQPIHERLLERLSEVFPVLSSPLLSARQEVLGFRERFFAYSTSAVVLGGVAFMLFWGWWKAHKFLETPFAQYELRGSSVLGTAIPAWATGWCEFLKLGAVFQIFVVASLGAFGGMALSGWDVPSTFEGYSTAVFDHNEFAAEDPDSFLTSWMGSDAADFSNILRTILSEVGYWVNLNTVVITFMTVILFMLSVWLAYFISVRVIIAATVFT